MSNETQTELDEKHAEAVALCEKKGRVTAALIQRELKISYVRASKIADAIKAAKTVAPAQETAGGATVISESETIAPETLEPETIGADVSADAYRSQEYDDGEPVEPAEPSILAASPLPLPFVRLAEGEHDIPLALIRESEKNTRTTFDEGGLLLLSETLADQDIGQVKPIDIYRLAEADADGHIFEVLDGARRFRGAKMAWAGSRGNGKNTIRARIVPMGTEAERLVRRLMSNSSEPLNPIDLGNACFELLKQCGGDKQKAARLANFGENGVRRFEQAMQLATNLIPPVMRALTDGRISKSHAELIVRLDNDDQKRALEACFRAVPINNGATHENEEVLISEKELRGWINTHCRDDDKQQQGKLFAGERAKDKNDLDREVQQREEEAANAMLANAGLKCSVCGADATHETSEGTPSCSACNPKRGLSASKDDPTSEPAPKFNAQESSDFAADTAKRVDRMALALEAITTIPDFDSTWLTRIALQMCPVHVDAPMFCKVYGCGMKIGSSNRVVWDEDTEGTVREYIQTLAGMAEVHACFHLRRCILVFLALPAANPAYPDDIIVALEAIAPEPVGLRAGKVSSAKKTKLQMRSGKPVFVKRNRNTGELGPLNGPKVSDGWEVGNITEDGDFVSIVSVKPKSKKPESAKKPSPAKKTAAKPVAKASDKISGAQIKKNVAAARKSKIKTTPKKKAKK
jgi:ParB-like chromosome segregation protein Spo0J